jgi:hypothetical protein
MFSRKPRNQWPYINGSRGRYLLASGIIYLIIGFSFLPARHGEARARFFGWMHELWNLDPGIIIGPIWLIAGLAMVVGGFLRRPRDRWSFAAAWCAPSILTFFYFVGYWYTRDPQSILAIAVYVFFSFMSAIVSGMEGDEERGERLRWEREHAQRGTNEGVN